MPIPQIAIVGRPNVGKSSLLNWLAGRRIAIVDPTPGVTRDRVAAPVRAGDRWFDLVDTGGMGNQDSDNLTAEVEHQISMAIDAAAAVLFVVDARAGLAPLDEMVAARLRAVGKPVLCVANKCDYPELDAQASDFFKFGCERVLPASAHHNRGRDALLEWIAAHLPPDNGEVVPDATLKLAIVGRRNTGKSTFINSLAEADRVIVSEVAGTTRDSVDVRFERDGKVIIAIDTAGVRRKGSIGSDVEFYSLARAERSIRRADVVLHFYDPQVPVSKVDKQLAGYILEQHTPAIFVVNKWDLMRPMPTGEFADYLQKTFPSLDFVPLAFITAKSGKNVQAVLNLAQSIQKQATARVTTGDLNRVLREALARQAPPQRQNRRAKIYYATQVATNPPTIVLFTNGPELFDNTYLRYLLKALRDHLPFREVPIKLLVRDRRQAGDTAEKEPEELAEVAPEPKATRKPAKGRRGRSPELWRD